MSPFQRINNNIQRRKQNVNLEDARRPSRTERLNDILRCGRPSNVGAVFSLQPALPAGSLAPPPSDAIQSGQWAAFCPSRPRELSNNSPATPELGSHNSIGPRPDAFSSRTELDAFRPRNELDASRVFYQLDGGQVSIHSQSPISPVSQATNASRFQESTHSGNRFHDGMILELDASSQEVHRHDTLNQQVHQLDGDCVMREAASLSSVNLIPHGMIASGSQYAHTSTNERTPNRTGSASFVAPLRPSAAKTKLDADGSRGFDCPIRAGPNGENSCTWPPSNNIWGFPFLARVKEHVGTHGLLCPDCDKVFTIPTKYKDHRNTKTPAGTCSDSGGKPGSRKHLALSPDAILNYFKQLDKGLSDHDAWLNGYKILHPDWEHHESLPSPFYMENIKKKQLTLVHEIPNNDHGSTLQFSNSSQSQVAPSVSTGQSTHENISPFTEDGVDPNFGRQQLAHDITDEFDFGQWLNDPALPSGEQNFANNVLDNMAFEMSGALPDSMKASGTSDGSQKRQSTSAFNPIALPFSAEATMVAGDQLYPANPDAMYSTKQLSLRTSMPSNEATSSNPYWQAPPREPGHIDSAMILCDTPDTPALGAEKSFTNYLTKPYTARGIGKQSVTTARLNTSALHDALQRARKLTAQVTKLKAQEVRLRDQVKATNLEKVLLQRRIEKVESEKESALDTLREIQDEVDAWDLDDERTVSLSDRMQKIKVLLPHF